jgi:hypothetical protein
VSARLAVRACALMSALVIVGQFPALAATQFAVTLALRQGMNMAYVPVRPSSGLRLATAYNLFGGPADVEAVGALGPDGRFRIYTGSHTAHGGFAVGPSAAVLAWMKVDKAIVVQGWLAPNTLDLAEGWNLVGLPRRSGATRRASDVHALSPAIDRVVSHVGAGPRARLRAYPTVDRVLYAGHGLLVHAARPITLSLVGEPWGPAIDETAAGEASALAFPSAAGWGRYARGGRGGRLLRVTSLASSGPGTLEAALATTGARTIIFETGGVIHRTSPLVVLEPYCTIAGQTAPGDGICIAGAPLVIQTHDVIVRGVRIRVGDDPDGPDADARDALMIGQDDDAGSDRDIHSIVIDHCSFSWAVDETVSVRTPAHHVTVQHSLIGESLNQSIHPKGAHGMGMLISHNVRFVTVYRNLFIHHNRRNPLIMGGAGAVVVNNLIAGWGEYATRIVDEWRLGPINCDIVGNVYQPGDSSGDVPVRVTAGVNRGSRIFLADNAARTEAALAAWAPPHALAQAATYAPIAHVLAARDLTPQMLDNVGAAAPHWDPVDIRLLEDARDGTGRIIDSPADVGGLPMYEPGEAHADYDQDGMPDAWETRRGLDPADAADALSDLDANGYADLEDYINSLLP